MVRILCAFGVLVSLFFAVKLFLLRQIPPGLALLGLSAALVRGALPKADSSG